MPLEQSEQTSDQNLSTRFYLLSWLAVVGPVVFFVAMVQYSGLTFPFWDHCEHIRDFARIHDHTQQFHDYWAPHNHSRPLVLRALVLGNGLLTDWDVGSEFIYLVGSVILAVIAQALCLRRLCGSWSPRCLILLTMLSIFSFSPAGHQNHWWSFMLQLDLTHLFAVLAFIAICLGPRKWKNNVLAALACWLATYTLSNGFIAFLAAGLTVQLAKPECKRFDRFTLFWLTNFVTVVCTYIPGLIETGGTLKHFLKLLKFVLAYLGCPVASLVVFPYKNMWDLPLVTVRNAWVGAALLLVAIGVFMLLRKGLATGQLSALLFFCFSTFAIGSAFLTGWGRAEFDSYGVANANAGRYTIYSTYLIYAFLYAATALKRGDLPAWLQTPTERNFHNTVIVLTAIIIGFAVNTYAKSANSVYRDAHGFNKALANAYLGNNPSDHRIIYPDPVAADRMVMELKRLHIGPFRFIYPQNGDPLTLLAANKSVDGFLVNGLRDMPKVGRVLTANPPSRYELPVSPSIKSVSFSYGILDNAVMASPNLAGVVFRVLLRQASGQDILLWSKTLRPVSELNDRGIQTATVAISTADGSEIVIETKAVDDPKDCWAYWQNVEIKN